MLFVFILSNTRLQKHQRGTFGDKLSHLIYISKTLSKFHQHSCVRNFTCLPKEQWLLCHAITNFPPASKLTDAFCIRAELISTFRLFQGHPDPFSRPPLIFFLHPFFELIYTFRSRQLWERTFAYIGGDINTKEPSHLYCLA